MSRPQISSPALVIYSFVALDDEARQGWAYLDRLWTACRAVGPATEPMLGITAPENLPDVPSGSGPFRIVASARRATAGPVRSMFVFTEHGTAGLIAAMSSDESWDTVVDEWTAAAPETGRSVLGEYTILLGHSPDPQALGPAGAGLARRLGATAVLPAASKGPSGSLLWDLPSDNENRHTFIVAAPTTTETQIDEWVWATEGHQGLGKLARYCLNIARARHQRRVHEALKPVSELVAETDKVTSALVTHLSTDTAQLLAADNQVQQLQIAESGLLWRLTRTQEMTATVRALLANTRRNRPTEDGMFARDDAELTWFADQLDREAEYLDALARRANAAQTASANAVTRLLTRRRERLTLVQTSILGALLMALAAIQAFQYTVPMDPVLKGPLTTTLACAAFGLPFLVARWSGVIPRSESYRWPDLLAALAFGGSLGWLLNTIGWLAHYPAPLWATLIAVVLGASLLAVPTWRRIRSAAQ
ncbi:hypothetical protein JOF56_006482 [Kibdelosporangium banguiense]|uniref:Uncharacterized protein n=1 Tax=Kibdelosporangium banguiense TaxID=1365924 RepID=A0ABS4TNW4_9PSEU|nr:CATRA conflict system CASPASE/TPR repeat-associated protein [Kibdelosporangium banguiense]MBP2326097.1 hypothetical protein [Kibdelosporangium banguiense]